jgi:lysophospholipase
MTKFRYGVPHAFSSAQCHKFVQRLEVFELQGQGGLRLHGCKHEQPGAHAWLAICLGRTEHVAIYAETLYDFALQGYNLLIYDHRGQGSSERLLPQAHIGHVDHFDDYVVDFEQVLQTFLTHQSLPIHVLAHSMGGAVVLRHAQIFKPCYQSMALVAPMLGIRLPIPYIWVRGIAKLWGRLFGEQAWIPGGQGFAPKPFSKNLITQDATRYQVYLQSFQANPRVQLGEPSVNWLLEALAVSEALVASTQALPIPCLLLQAGSECIVSNPAQAQFAKAQAEVTLLLIEKAAHQILLESDPIRATCLNAILDHFKAHS